jgi:hypothetical protein
MPTMAIDLTHDIIAELRREVLAELKKLHEEIEEVRILVLTPDEARSQVRHSRRRQ